MSRCLLVRTAISRRTLLLAGLFLVSGSAGWSSAGDQSPVGYRYEWAIRYETGQVLCTVTETRDDPCNRPVGPLPLGA